MVGVDFPFIRAGSLQEAKVVFWQPIANDGSGDIAGLELIIPPPDGAQPARLIDQADIWNIDYWALGFPTGHDNGVYSRGRILAKLPNDHVQLEAKSQYKILGGFSGTAVWSDQANGIVGILVTGESNPSIKAGFMIPSAVLAKAWEKVQCDEQLPIPQPDLLPTVGGAVAPSSPFQCCNPTLSRRFH
jgi:hypothetical protein